MNKEEEYIFFQEVSPQNGNDTANSIIEKAPILGDFANLHEEMLQKCNPKNFMHPYDSTKIEIANEIYEQVRNNYNEDLLVLLRNRSINELNISFSTINLYSKLVKACNPENFVDDNYDPDKLIKANSLFPKIKKNADNIIELESIEKEATELLLIQQQKDEKERERLLEEKRQLKLIKQEKVKLEREEWIKFLVIIVFIFIILCLVFGIQ